MTYYHRYVVTVATTERMESGKYFPSRHSTINAVNLADARAIAEALTMADSDTVTRRCDVCVAVFIGRKPVNIPVDDVANTIKSLNETLDNARQHVRSKAT